MSSQFELVTKTLVCGCIDDPDRTRLVVTIADIESLAAGVVAKVVNIIPKVDGSDRIERRAIVDLELPFVASHEQFV